MEGSLIEPSFELGLEGLEFEKMFSNQNCMILKWENPGSFNELMSNDYYCYFKRFNKIIKS
jgi:hypothetical protein